MAACCQTSRRVKSRDSRVSLPPSSLSPSDLPENADDEDEDEREAGLCNVGVKSVRMATRFEASLLHPTETAPIRTGDILPWPVRNSHRRRARKRIGQRLTTDAGSMLPKRLRIGSEYVATCLC